MSEKTEKTAELAEAPAGGEAAAPAASEVTTPAGSEATAAVAAAASAAPVSKPSKPSKSRKTSKGGRNWFGHQTVVELVGLAITAAVTAPLVFLLPKIAAYLIGVNAATLVLYAIDKVAAARGWRRIPEQALLSFAVLGGTPAAVLSQRWFRHKRARSKFRKQLNLVLASQVVTLALAGVAWYF